MTLLCLFSRGHRDTVPQEASVEQLAQMIAHDESVKSFTGLCRHYLNQGDGKRAAEFKSRIPCFSVAVTFKGGKSEKCITGCTYLSLVDVDDLDSAEDVHRLWRIAMDDSHTLLAYPTASGLGLRIIFPYTLEGTDTDLDELFRTDRQRAKKMYGQVFTQGNEYYRKLLGVETDTQCKDCTRLSGLAHCANVYYNPRAAPLAITPTEEKVVKRSRHHSTVAKAVPVVKGILTNRGVEYVEGNRNNYICQAGYLLNQYGVELADAVEWAEEEFADYRDKPSVADIIRSCYHKTDEHGKEKLSRKESVPKYATVSEIEAFLTGEADFRYNEITRMNEIRWKGEETFRSITDRDESTLWRRMNRSERPARFNDLRLVLSSEYVPFFSPFKDYFYHLPTWQEGDTDYIRLLADTVTLANSSPEAKATFEHCLKKWLVAMVAGFLSDRVNHEILVFIGRQGIYKTTWFHYLLPPELRTYYVAKTNTRRMTKDDRLLMAESGLICLEEIVTMTDEEVDQIKAAATLPQIVERAAYARNKEVRPNLASFCGTGNHVQFLTDTSGNRRWLPFEVTDILSPYSHPIEYTGLYSQVLHLWKSGFVYWFDTDEIRSLERHLEQFEALSLEEELILKHYRKPGPTDHAVFRSTADILLRINTGLKQPLNAIKIGIIMKKMGFKQMRLGNGKRGYRLIELSFDEIAREGITDAPPVERQSKLEF